MEGNIEITIKTVPGGRVLTNVNGKKCSEKDVLEVLTASFCATVADCMKKVPQRMRRQRCKEFGQMMENMLLAMMNGGARVAQRFEGRDAEFIEELMKRQGEVQDQ